MADKKNSFQKDQHVKWDWGDGTATGQVKERFERDVDVIKNQEGLTDM